jgi:hypothetical protein
VSPVRNGPTPVPREHVRAKRSRPCRRAGDGRERLLETLAPWRTKPARPPTRCARRASGDLQPGSRRSSATTPCASPSMDPMRRARPRWPARFAACLADVHRRPAICVSLDGLHLDQRRRHRRGRPSPEGYIDDSFDYASLKRVVLDPLRPGATMRFRHVVFDFRTDAPVAGPRWASHNPDRSTRCGHTQSFPRPVSGGLRGRVRPGIRCVGTNTRRVALSAPLREARRGSGRGARRWVGAADWAITRRGGVRC